MAAILILPTERRFVTGFGCRNCESCPFSRAMQSDYKSVLQGQNENCRGNGLTAGIGNGYDVECDVKLIVFHYHLRPGGIRRIIELGTPWIVKESRPAITEVCIFTGDKPDPEWETLMRKKLAGTQLTFLNAPSVHYLAEQKQSSTTLKQDLQRSIAEVFEGAKTNNTLLWAHNLSIARNLPAAAVLLQICRERDIKVVLHHHDWWFENRWSRWPEMKEFGIRTLDKTGEILFPNGGRVTHACINHADYDVLKRHLPGKTQWLPNLTEPRKPSTRSNLKSTRQWLYESLGIGDQPVWTVPCRLLRRKNIAESLLITRWLRPEATLLITGGVSSAEERAYADRLAQAAREEKWNLVMGALQGTETHKPAVEDLLGASEVVMLTSIQEGFGLPYLEAASSQRPLIARSLPNIAPDLKKFGFHFPQYYDDLFIDPGLLDWHQEVIRQKRVFATWKRQIPLRCRSWLEVPFLLDEKAIPRPIPFSRLTLTGQLEVLRQPTEVSWNVCSELNPFLKGWKERAERADLQTSAWPVKADQWLSGSAYGRHFQKMTQSIKPGDLQNPSDPRHLLEDFIKTKLKSRCLFPLLMSTDT